MSACRAGVDLTDPPMTWDVEADAGATAVAARTEVVVATDRSTDNSIPGSDSSTTSIASDASTPARSGVDVDTVDREIVVERDAMTGGADAGMNAKPADTRGRDGNVGAQLTSDGSKFDAGAVEGSLTDTDQAAVVSSHADASAVDQGSTDTTPTAVVTSDPDAGLGACLYDDDLDGDGWLDCQDPDDDDDGIPDELDEDPFNPQPGTSWPGSILADPCVKAARADYENRRQSGDPNLLPLDLRTGHNLPDISGYYRNTSDVTLFVATTGSAALGHLVGSEGHYLRTGEDTYDNWGVAFAPPEGAIGGWSSPRHVYRGSPDYLSDFVKEGTTVYISGGPIDPSTGNLLDHMGLAILVSESGTYPGGQCPSVAWNAYLTTLVTKITVSDLLYMCKDGAAGYVPEQAWTRENGTQCTCNLVDGASQLSCSSL